ncbi:MAG: DNA-binding response regulator [Acidobacteria bacterium]|nr:DNA-binding response regulator [Acidobacteriota bacterium]
MDVGVEEAAQVLVVDDDDTLRAMTSLVLRRAGLRIAQAKDGGEAIGRMQQARYEVVVLDLMMPRVSGWDVIRWMSDHRDQKPRILVVLTAANRKILDELDPEIVNTILFKPFDIHELAAYVKACCEGFVAGEPED